MKGKKLHLFCLMGLLALATLSAEARNLKWWATDKAPTKPGIRRVCVGQMTGNKARVPTGGKKSLIEVRQESDKMWDFQRIGVSWGLLALVLAGLMARRVGIEPRIVVLLTVRRTGAPIIKLNGKSRIRRYFHET